jgi:hypothetical protein
MSARLLQLLGVQVCTVDAADNCNCCCTRCCSWLLHQLLYGMLQLLLYSCVL